jgi:hypothetical protein
MMASLQLVRWRKSGSFEWDAGGNRKGNLETDPAHQIQLWLAFLFLFCASVEYHRRISPLATVTSLVTHSVRTREVKSRVAEASRLAARSLWRAQNHFGDLYRRWKAPKEKRAPEPGKSAAQGRLLRGGAVVLSKSAIYSPGSCGGRFCRRRRRTGIGGRVRRRQC